MENNPPIPYLRKRSINLVAFLSVMKANHLPTNPAIYFFHPLNILSHQKEEKLLFILFWYFLILVFLIPIFFTYFLIFLAIDRKYFGIIFFGSGSLTITQFFTSRMARCVFVRTYSQLALCSCKYILISARWLSIKQKNILL